MSKKKCGGRGWGKSWLIIEEAGPVGSQCQYKPDDVRAPAQTTQHTEIVRMAKSGPLDVTNA